MKSGAFGFSAMRHFIFLLMPVFFLLSGCAGGVDPKTLDLADEARRTFDAAYVMIPVRGEPIEGRISDDFVQRKLASLKKKRPTVIFMHGCAGFGPWSLRYMRLLARAGYAVVAPDSFARRYRPETCIPSEHSLITGAPFGRVGRMRQEEIHHAVYRLRRIHWADKKNLFLMGQSQGGAAAAAYEGTEFSAHVIAGSTCWRGVWVPLGTPAFALYSKDDPWRRNRAADSCLRKAEGRGVKMEFHLFEGRAHNLSRNERARRLILDFLNRHRRTE
ncbi:MAG: dienelactone hydrolase family protein [Nitrospinae bacterium]|nr:dienelactone hydrolase family protein [Nitrospinota bacterium]